MWSGRSLAENTRVQIHISYELQRIYSDCTKKIFFAEKSRRSSQDFWRSWSKSWIGKLWNSGFFLFCVASCSNSFVLNSCNSVFMCRRNVCLKTLVSWGLSEFVGHVSVILKQILIYLREQFEEMKYCYIHK